MEQDTSVSSKLVKCGADLNATSCVGGIGSGDALCLTNHTGPLCRVCKPGFYHSSAIGSCDECPSGGRLGFWYAVAALVGVMLAGALIYRFFFHGDNLPPTLRKLRHRWLRRGQRMLAVVTQFDLIAFGKVLLSFYQVVAIVEPTYVARLPPEYLAWVPRFINLDLLQAAIPAQCVGRYLDRILLYGFLPFSVMILILVWSFVAVVFRRKASNTQQESSQCFRQLCDMAKQVEFYALPALLITSFILLPIVANMIFAAFDCRPIDLGNGASASYLAVEPSVTCALDDAQYRAIHTTAIVLIVVWPAAMPIAFFVILRSSREAIVERRPTRLSHAARFLYREYVPECYLWEVLEMMRKLFLVGYVLLIPRNMAVLRLLAGLTISTLYIILVVKAQPFKSQRGNYAAILAATSLNFLFLGALICHIFDRVVTLDMIPLDFLGFDSVLPLTAPLLVVTFAVLVLVLFFMLDAARRARRLKTLRAKATGQAPELSLVSGQ